MPASDWIAPLYMIVLVPGIITAKAIIKAAVAIIKVAVAAIMAHATPGEAIPMANTAGATPGGGLVAVTHHGLNHPDGTTVDHGHAGGTDLAAEASLSSQEDATATDLTPQITSVPQSLQKGNSIEQVEQTVVVTSHRSHPTKPVTKSLCS